MPRRSRKVPWALVGGACVALGLACGTADGPRLADDASVDERGVERDGAAPEDASDGGGPVVLRPAPADFFLLVDSSASWIGRSDRWEGLKLALSSFLATHGQKHDFAAMSFPQLDGAAERCDALAYASPILDWQTSPSAIDAFIAGLTLQGKSPLGPALAGAIASARGHQGGGRARSTSIVVLTDATPMEDDTCDATDWSKMAEAAAGAFAQGLGDSIHVDVLSVMGPATAPNHLGALSEIAIRGGGMAAFVNGGRDDVNRSARRALELLRDRHTVCTLLVPPGIRPDALMLTFPDGTIQSASRVPDASHCVGPSFYLDNPDSPATATLCSGEGGIGGFCEATYVRAWTLGLPTVTIAAPPH